MGDNPTTLAALKVLKRLTESEESRTGALEKQTNANTKRRNPSPRRNVAKKPPISHPIGPTLDEAIGGVLVNDRQQNQEKNLLESNIFNRLKDGETGSPPANQKPLGAKSKERKEKTAPQNAVPPPERKEKCPPIFVKGDPPGMRSSLRKCIARGLRCTFRLCTDGVKIITDEKSHYQMVLGFLDERKYEYFTHDDPTTKPMKVVLRGLDNMDVKELTAELEGRHLKISNIFKIVRHDQSRKYRDQLYLIHLERGSISVKDLKSIRTVNDTMVKWERYRPAHRDVTQCMNCFNFGHGTKNCHMAPRCKKCGDKHPSDMCDAMEEADPKCVNCGDKHWATSKHCPKRHEFIAIRKKAAVNNQPNRTRPPALNEVNFPQLVAGNQPSTTELPRSQWPPLHPPGFRKQQGEALPAEDALPPYTSEQLVPIYKELVARLRSCKTRIDQIYALGLFVIENGF